MGLIKAAFSSIGTVLADQWKEYIYCDALDGDTLMAKGEVRINKGSSNTKRSDNIITNGSKIAVNEGQCMLIVENGKIVDFTTEAGAYTYDTGTEPSLFDSGFSGLKESFAKVGKRFTFGGQPENDQRVYFINTKEIMNNKIGIGDVPFRDSEFNFTIKIQGYGTYSYRITNPVMFYTNVCANVADVYKKISIDEQLKTDFTVESLTLNVVDTAQAAFFYDNLFGEELPLSIHFEKAEGPDLQVSPDQTWDLEILEFKVAEDYDLLALHDKLEKEQFSSYLDSKGNLLALTDMSNIEVWFTK